MTAEAIKQVEHTTFGNFRKPRSYGYGNYSTLTTLLGISGLLGFDVSAFFFGIITALIFGVVWFLILALLSFKDTHHRSQLQKIGARMAFARAKRKGDVDYLSGPTTEFGTFRLPGLLASSNLTEHITTAGQAFGMLHYPKQNRYVVAYRCEPDGASLLDTADAEMQVARWAAFLEAAAMEPGLRQVQVSIETAPDSGSNLRNAVEARLDPNAPELALKVMGQIVRTYPATSARMTSWVVLTYAAMGRDRDESTAFLADRLPQMAQTLVGTGAGTPEPVDGLGFSHMALTAYSPELAEPLENTDVETVIRWSDVGPAAAHASWGYYRHSAGVSCTFGMTEGPQRNINMRTFNALVEPHADIPHKRITLIYTPHSPAVSANLASKDVSATTARINTSKRPNARALKDKDAADLTAQEEADGASLIDFTILATVTCTDDKALTKAKAALQMSSPVARIRLRPLDGSQDSAFALTLPVGLVPADVTTIPSGIREGF